MCFLKCVLAAFVTGFGFVTSPMFTIGRGLRESSTVCGVYLRSHGADTDRDKLQGKWKFEGKNGDAPVEVILEIEQDAVTIREHRGKTTVVLKGKIVLNDKALPKQMTITEPTGALSDGGEKHTFPDLLAIYAFEGEDLKLCRGRPDEPRPSAFAPDSSSLPGTLIFKRIKK
jgi:uncharacterized protein (TIGR03067 family)